MDRNGTPIFGSHGFTCISIPDAANFLRDVVQPLLQVHTNPSARRWRQPISLLDQVVLQDIEQLAGTENVLPLPKSFSVDLQLTVVGVILTRHTHVQESGVDRGF